MQIQPSPLHAPSGLRVIAADPAAGATLARPAAAYIEALMRAFPVPVRFRVAHIAAMGRGEIVGAGALGDAVLRDGKQLLGTWPWVPAAYADRRFGGLQPWEMLLRAQLAWAQRQGETAIVLATTARQLAPVLRDIEDIGGDFARDIVSGGVPLPRHWVAVRVHVQAGLAAVEAKRLAAVVLMRYTRAANRPVPPRR